LNNAGKIILGAEDESGRMVDINESEEEWK
jgi:hypothetical protein